ncbi:MAG: M28 family peptidase [Planctomycetales bacterium]|nr:M28 family peptidase [Planctomycetales bacterium]
MPGSRGDALAQGYVSAQFESLGFQPAAPGGGWFQKVPLVGVQTHMPPTVTVQHGDQSLQLKRIDDFVMNIGPPISAVEIEDAELVFVGYGMIAPEYNWNDYKDADLRGKILVMMNNDPADDPELFAGRRRLYYGRWDYKYQMAAKQGAAGAIIIHTTPSAGYPYQVVQTSWTGEEFQLRDSREPRAKMTGWFTEEVARRVIALSGFDLDELRQAAEHRDFQPVPLKSTLSVSLTADVREQDTANVLAMLPGSDPKLKGEVVVYVAHHDHIGMSVERDETGDRIYNGAVDNASGVGALLAIASAYASLSAPPPRSILFATVGAEEQGLLGSAFMAQHPPVPAGQLAAVLNIDGVNTIGPTHDINVIGFGKSNLDDVVGKVAQWQGRVVTPEQAPDRGYYYRSDQFSLAKIGVPGIYLHSGTQVVDKPAGWGKAQLDHWIETTYHQRSDEYRDDWDLRGATMDIQLMFYAGTMIAEQPEMPQWTPGDEFEAARQAALQATSPE